MKKRTIKQQVEYADQQVLNRNKGFHDELVGEQFAKKKKLAKKSIFIGAGSVLAAATAIILCLVFLLPPSAEKKLYLLENEKIIDFNMIEINSKTNGIDFEIADYFTSEIYRIYDSVYNDTLYYHIFLTSQTTFETASIFVYVNPDYERQKQLKEQPIPASVGDFEINYNKDVAQDDLGFNVVKHTAATEYNGIRIYIEHEQLSLNEESSFTNFFEQTIKKA